MSHLLRWIFALYLIAVPFGAVAEQARETEWDELAAPMPPEIRLQLESLMDIDPMDIRTDEQLDAEWLALQEKAFPVVKEFDGVLIRIPGFVVPVDLEADVVREFLLVPYLGACIHVPPPPPNQVIYVKSQKEYTVSELFDPVWVTGRIKIETMSTDLAESGYVLHSDEIVRYVVD